MNHFKQKMNVKPGLHISRKDRKYMVGNTFVSFSRMLWSSHSCNDRRYSYFTRCVDSLKLQLHDAIYRLGFYSNSLIRILSLSNSRNNVASIQKNQGDKLHRVTVALKSSSEHRRKHVLRL